MRSAVLLLALVAAVAATALPRPAEKAVQPAAPKTEHLTKEVVHSKKPRNWYMKFYYDTFVETGKLGVLNNMFCTLCEDIVNDVENFGEETAMDYLSDAVTDLCSGLPYKNLQTDCYNYIMSVAQDLIDLLNNNAGGEQACTLIELC